MEDKATTLCGTEKLGVDFIIEVTAKCLSIGKEVPSVSCVQQIFPVNTEKSGKTRTGVWLSVLLCANCLA